MTANRSLLLTVAAIACFIVALLLALNVIDSGNQDAWMLGGLVAFAASHLP